jgi:hypothetical protein
MTYSATTLLNGSNGEALRGLALSAINFELSRQVSNHPSLKMPTEKLETPDELRDLVMMPEHIEHDKPKLDQLVDGLIATCALIKDLAGRSDYNASGQLVHPFAWLAGRARTPQSAVVDSFAWRSNMAAKVAGEQATLLGIANPELVEQKARERADAENKERRDYAIAEVRSVQNVALMTAEENELVELLLDLDGQTFNILKLAKAAAQADVERAKQRLLAGKYAVCDEEIMLFAKA